MKKYFFLLMLLKVLSLQAQEPYTCNVPSSCYAQTRSVNISTGFNMVSGTLDAPTTITGNWNLVQAPTEAGITLPAPVWSIIPNSGWGIFPNAGWVSAFPTSQSELDNLPPLNPYVFEKCFCLCRNDSITIAFEMMADDQGIVLLDGVPITPIPAPNATQFQFANRVIHQSTRWLAEGQHCLRVQVRNINNIAVGLSLEGSITGKSRASLLVNTCCNTNGKICGIILKDGEDVNCSGYANPAIDMPLPGFEVILRDAAGNERGRAITDANGCYCFTGLAPGNYTVSQVMQNGWIQSSPAAGGSQSVSIVAAETATANFVNCSRPGKICGIKFLDYNCNGKVDAIDDVALPGWTIILSDNTGSPIATTTTDQDGSYCFYNLEVNKEYQVAEVNQEGWTQSAPPTTFYTVVTQLAGDTGINFGNCPTNIDACDIDIDLEIEQSNCSITATVQVLRNPWNLPVFSTRWSWGDNFGGTATALPYASYTYGTAGQYLVFVRVAFKRGDVVCIKTISKLVNIGSCSGGIDGGLFDGGFNTLENSDLLGQNIPNPLTSTSTIQYTLPDDCKKANIIIKNQDGQLVKRYELNVLVKHDKLVIDGNALSSKGRYYYALEVDDQIIAVKSLIKE